MPSSKPLAGRTLPFKPPRPAASATPKNANSSSSSAITTGSTSARSRTSGEKVGRASPTPSSESSDEDDREKRIEVTAADSRKSNPSVKQSKPAGRATEPPQARSDPSRAPPSSSALMDSAIPPDLLKHLIRIHFRDPDVQIGREAGQLVSTYIEIFVREALTRALQEKQLAQEQGGSARDFLEVEHLEKLAPQLILDF